MLNLIMGARQLIVPVGAVIIGTGHPLVVGAIAMLVAVIAVGWRLLAWSRFSYRIEDGMLRIDEGVLRRDRREVPLTRIQQVDLRRKLRHRVLGVAVVRIDTAGGGGGAEVSLEALSDADALELRTALLTRRPAGSGPAMADRRVGGTADTGGGSVGASIDARGPASFGEAGSPEVPGELLVHLGPRELVIAGITGSGLAAGLTLVGALYAVIAQVSQSAVASATDKVADLVKLAPVALALGIGVVIAWLVVAAGTSVLRDHDFTLVRYGPDLHLRRGLLDQREATLALHRIQAVRVRDNPLRRRIGTVSVQLQSAGSGSSSEGDVTRLTIPIVRTTDLDGLLDLVIPGSAPRPDLVSAPTAARRRARNRYGAGALLITVLAVGVSRSPWALGALALLVPAMFLAGLTYRALGHAATATHVVTRWGGVFGHTVIVPVAKTQSCRLVSTPFQRRVSLATLHIDVAGRGSAIAVVDGDLGRLGAVRNAALASRVARLDEQATRRRTQESLGSSPDHAGDNLVGSAAVSETAAPT